MLTTSRKPLQTAPSQRSTSRRPLSFEEALYKRMNEAQRWPTSTPAAHHPSHPLLRPLTQPMIHFTDVG